jgi:hypothetical protein
VEYKHLVRDVWYLGYPIMGERVKMCEMVKMIRLVGLIEMCEYNKRLIFVCFMMKAFGLC